MNKNLLRKFFLASCALSSIAYNPYISLAGTSGGGGGGTSYPLAITVYDQNGSYDQNLQSPINLTDGTLGIPTNAATKYKADDILLQSQENFIIKSMDVNNHIGAGLTVHGISVDQSVQSSILNAKNSLISLDLSAGNVPLASNDPVVTNITNNPNNSSIITLLNSINGNSPFVANPSNTLPNLQFSLGSNYTSSNYQDLWSAAANLASNLNDINAGTSGPNITTQLANNLNIIYNQIYAVNLPTYLPSTLQLGSVTNSTGAQKLNLTLNDNQTLVLTGDNMWDLPQDIFTGTNSYITLNNPAPKALYSYAPKISGTVDVVSFTGVISNVTLNGISSPSIPNGAVITITGGGLSSPVNYPWNNSQSDLQNINYALSAVSSSLPSNTTLNISYVGTPSYITTTNGDSKITGLTAGSTYVVAGPYNTYTALGTISVGAGSNIVVNAARGNSITLSSPFNFGSNNNSATFDAETDVEINDVSFAGFSNGNITGKNTSAITINIQTNNGIPVTSNTNSITLGNAWSQTGNGAYDSNNNWVPGVPNGFNTMNPGQYLGYLKILTPTTITDPSATNIGIGSNTSGINIGNTTVTLAPTSNNFNTNTILAYRATPIADTTNLIVQSGNAGGDLQVALASGFTNSQSGAAFSGNITFDTTKNMITSNTYSLEILPSNSFGSGQVPLQSVTFKGDGAIIINPTIYYSSINFNLSSTGSVIFQSLSQAPVLVDGGSLTLSQNVPQGSIINMKALDSASSSGGPSQYAAYTKGITLNLGSYTLNAGAVNNQTPQLRSLITLSGPLTVNTAVNTNNPNNISIGNITVDGTIPGPQTSPTPSTLDLSYVTAMTVNFTHDPAFLPANNQLLPFFVATNGAIITPPTATNLQVTINPTSSHMTQSKTVSFSYDPASYSIKAKVDLTQVTSGLPSNSPGTTLAQNLVNNSLQDTSTPADQVSPAVQQLVTAVLSAPNATAAAVAAESLVPQADAYAAILEAAGLTTDRINDHMVGDAIVDNFVDAVPVNVTSNDERLGASAGDTFRSGVWASGFMQMAVQKSYGTKTGYKVRTNGGTFGADTKLNDNVTLGAAWTMTHGIVSQKGSNPSNKPATNNNILSLYGLVDLNQGWLLNGSLSGGLAKTTSTIIQKFGGVKDVFGGFKQKSKLYSANVQIQKLVAAGEHVVLQSTLGLSYNQFNDEGYTQTGDITPQTVSSRKSYNFEGLVGGKVLGIFNHNDFIIKPNLSAFAHITIKDKKGKIHTSLDNTTGRVAIEQEKASSAWYSAGTGLFVTKGAWEAGVSYELQLDKKYRRAFGLYKT